MDYIELSAFPSVAQNAPASLSTNELDGRSLHGLIFVLSGATFTKAHINSLQIKGGGKTLVEDITGTELQELNDHDGLQSSAKYLSFFLGDPTARTVRGQHLGDLDLSIYRNNLEIKLDLGAAGADCGLKVIAMVGVPKLKMNIGLDALDAAMCRALIPTVMTPSEAVTRQAVGVGLGSGAGARLRKIAFFHANLTKVLMKKGGEDKHDDLTIADNDFINGEYARVATAGLYVINRVADGNQGEAETTLQDDGSVWSFQVKISTSAADNINAFADVHTAPPLL